MNAIIVNNQVLEVSPECMQVLLQVARTMGATTATTELRSNSPLQAQPVANVAEPTHTPKVYDHVTEGFTDFVFVRKDNTVRVTHKDGKFLHEKAPRQVLNNRLKAAGFVYDKEAKAWTLTTKGGKRDIKGTEKFVSENSHEVTADEINAIRDGWTKSSEKRAKKATK